MSEVKFTEAPWTKCERGDYSDYGGDCIVILGDDGLQRVAIVFEDADAALIVSAPDVLAALEAAQAALAMMIEPNSIEKTTLPVAFAQATEAEVKARAAIARARGDQS